MDSETPGFARHQRNAAHLALAPELAPGHGLNPETGQPVVFGCRHHLLEEIRQVEQRPASLRISAQVAQMSPEIKPGCGPAGIIVVRRLCHEMAQLHHRVDRILVAQKQLLKARGARGSRACGQLTSSKNVYGATFARSEESSSGGALQCVEQRSDESTQQTRMPGAFLRRGRKMRGRMGIGPGMRPSAIQFQDRSCSGSLQARLLLAHRRVSLDRSGTSTAERENRARP
jgi:hypothetical protein